MDVISVYEDVVRDNVFASENGNFGYEMFNRLSKRAELRLLDWLSGDTENTRPPQPYLSQKNKDWLSPFITKYPQQVAGGVITKPADYYGYENLYLLTASGQTVCDDDDVKVRKKPVELLDGDQFYERDNTSIEGLAPSLGRPIVKVVGNTLEFLPQDLGSVVLEYIRYPKFGVVAFKDDPVYNDVIADPSSSTDYEWEEYARELLIWFITDTYSIHTREQALKQSNIISGKTARDAKS